MFKLFSLFKSKEKPKSKTNEWFKEQESLQSEKSSRFKKDFIRSAHPIRQKKDIFKPYIPPKGVIPEGMQVRANDSGVLRAFDNMPSGASSPITAGGYSGFPGYAYLSQLTQMPEYRNISTVFAEEMTRKGIKLQLEGSTVDNDILQKLYEAMRKYNMMGIVSKMVESDGFYGRGQVYIDLRNEDGYRIKDIPSELESDLIISERQIPKNSLIGFKSIEPVWTFPNMFNSSDPFDKYYYQPQSWFVLGKKVHASRMITFVTHEVSDLLKPAYNFGGISRSQLVETYVQNFLRTRDSVSDLIHAFVTPVFSTNMEAMLQKGAMCEITDRVHYLANYRTNHDVFVINKETEGLQNIVAPLGGLHQLQSQSLEQICTAARILSSKYTGQTPSGLNVNSEGEIRMFYDSIAGMQEKKLRDPIQKMLEIIQLSVFGKIYSEITFEFNDLFELTEKEKAELQLANAKADSELLAASAITPRQAMIKTMNDPLSPYYQQERPMDELDDGELDEAI